MSDLEFAFSRPIIYNISVENHEHKFNIVEINLFTPAQGRKLISSLPLGRVTKKINGSLCVSDTQLKRRELNKAQKYSSSSFPPQKCSMNRC